MIATHHAIATGTACSSGQAGCAGRPVGLPNRSRSAAVTALIGFHSANWRSPSGRSPVATNVLARNVSGKIRMKTTPCAASAERTSRPSMIPAQIIA